MQFAFHQENGPQIICIFARLAMILIMHAEIQNPHRCTQTLRHDIRQSRRPCFKEKGHCSLHCVLPYLTSQKCKSDLIWGHSVAVQHYVRARSPATSVLVLSSFLYKSHELISNVFPKLFGNIGKNLRISEFKEDVGIKLRPYTHFRCEWMGLNRAEPPYNLLGNPRAYLGILLCLPQCTKSSIRLQPGDTSSGTMLRQ